MRQCLRTNTLIIFGLTELKITTIDYMVVHVHVLSLRSKRQILCH